MQVTDQEIFVSESGEGPALLLLHGGGPGSNGASSFQRNIDPLEKRFRVTVPDLPGYGRSSKVTDPTDPFGFAAAAIMDLLHTMGITRTHIVGYSYGGAVALRIAVEQPHLVDRLVLIAPGGVGTTRMLPTRGLRRLVGYYAGQGPSREKLERIVRDHLVADSSDIAEELIEDRYQASLDPNIIANPPLRRPTGLGGFRTLWRMDLTRDSRLRTMTAPTLVVWGMADKVNRPRGARMLARALPNCDVYLRADTGHWVQWETAC